MPAGEAARAKADRAAVSPASAPGLAGLAGLASMSAIMRACCGASGGAGVPRQQRIQQRLVQLGGWPAGKWEPRHLAGGSV